MIEIKRLKVIVFFSLLFVSENCFSQLINKDSITIIGDQNRNLKKIKFDEYTFNFKDHKLTELYSQDTSFCFFASLNRYAVKSKYGLEYTIAFEADQVVIISKGKDSTYQFKYKEHSGLNGNSGFSSWHSNLDSSIIGITYKDGVMYSFMFFDHSFGAISFLLEVGGNEQTKIEYFKLSSIGAHSKSRSDKSMHPGIRISFNSQATEVSNIEFFDQTELVVFELLSKKRSLANIKLNEMRVKKRTNKQTEVYQYNTFLTWTDAGKPLKGKEYILSEQ